MEYNGEAEEKIGRIRAFVQRHVNKINKNVFSKSVKLFGKNSFINRSVIKIADNGNLF
mgnify:CR=1 FL=1